MEGHFLTGQSAQWVVVLMEEEEEEEDKIENNGIGGACSAYGGQERRIQMCG